MSWSAFFNTLRFSGKIYFIFDASVSLSLVLGKSLSSSKFHSKWCLHVHQNRCYWTSFTVPIYQFKSNRTLSSNVRWSANCLKAIINFVYFLFHWFVAGLNGSCSFAQNEPDSWRINPWQSKLDWNNHRYFRFTTVVCCDEIWNCVWDVQALLNLKIYSDGYIVRCVTMMQHYHNIMFV